MELLFQYINRNVLSQTSRFIHDNPYYDFKNMYPIWVMQDRNRIPMHQMEDRHLRNTIAMLEKKHLYDRIYFQYLKGSPQEIDYAVYSLSFLQGYTPETIREDYYDIVHGNYVAMPLKEQLFILYFKGFPYLLLRREEIRRRLQTQWKMELSLRSFAPPLMNQG